MAYDDFWGDVGVDPGAGSVQYGAGGGGYEGGTGTQGLGFFGNDPFGYTGGSFLTPWTQKFVAPGGGGGGGGGIAMDPFSYADFGYDYRAPGAFQGQQDIHPDTFGYADFQSPEAFRAPTAADMEADPSFQFRMKAGRDAMLANAASKGLARSGDFAKAMADYNQNAASQEYDKVYGRRKSEYDTAAQLARQDYATRYGTAKDINEMNASRRFNAADANNRNRLAAYQASTDANIRGNELGYNIASGVYDRNRQNAKEAYDSAMAIASANASAGRASEDEAYRRALNEYQMNYDIFQNNQNNQFNRTMALMDFGRGAAGAQGGYGSDYADRQGNTYGQAANAAAGSKVAQGNAWASGLSGLGNAAAGGLMAYGQYKNPSFGTKLPKLTLPK